MLTDSNSAGLVCQEREVATFAESDKAPESGRRSKRRNPKSPRQLRREINAKKDSLENWAFELGEACEALVSDDGNEEWRLSMCRHAITLFELALEGEVMSTRLSLRILTELLADIPKAVDDLVGSSWQSTKEGWFPRWDAQSRRNMSKLKAQDARRSGEGHD